MGHMTKVMYISGRILFGFYFIVAGMMKVLSPWPSRRCITETSEKDSGLFRRASKDKKFYRAIESL